MEKNIVVVDPRVVERAYPSALRESARSGCRGHFADIVCFMTTEQCSLQDYRCQSLRNDGGKRALLRRQTVRFECHCNGIRSVYVHREESRATERTAEVVHASHQGPNVARLSKQECISAYVISFVSGYAGISLRTSSYKPLLTFNA